MSAEENAATAQQGYAAFGRGDLAAILELLTDDIEWIESGRRTSFRGWNVSWQRRGEPVLRNPRRGDGDSEVRAA